jgi:hypothetical protein
MKLSHLAFAVALATLGASASAVTMVSAQLGVNPNFSGGTGPVSSVLNDAAWAELSSGLVTGGFNSSGTGHALAQIGTLKVDGTSEGSLNSVVRASFRDDFKLDIPGVAANTQVTVNFQLLFDGSLHVNNSNIASASWQVRADMGGGAYDLGGDATLYNNSPVLAVHGYVGTPLANLTGTATFMTGQTLPLFVELTGAAQTAYDGYGGALAASSFDLSHTLRWGGMTVWLNGVPQSQVTLTSGSGFNYLEAAPVPEPGTGVLIGLGAALLLRRRRMR